jgi:hypothetical protein
MREYTIPIGMIASRAGVCSDPRDSGGTGNTCEDPAVVSSSKECCP